MEKKLYVTSTIIWTLCTIAAVILYYLENDLPWMICALSSLSAAASSAINICLSNN